MKCIMDYSNYPFDSQKCSVQFGSTAYSDDQMVFSGSFEYKHENQRDIQYKVINFGLKHSDNEAMPK